MNINNKKTVFPVTIGKEGIDNFWLKEGNGTIHTWEEKHIITRLFSEGKLVPDNYSEWDMIIENNKKAT